MKQKDDYIKRSDARAAVRGFEMWDAHGECNLYAEHEIDEIPTADVRENVITKNIGKDYEDGDRFICDHCGIELRDWVIIEDIIGCHVSHRGYVFKFCPECGAVIT